MRIPAQVISQFKQQAKAAFPRETFAYLIGIDAGTSVEVEGLYVPDGMDENCTVHAVMIEPHWEIEAAEHAREDGREVLGDFHSHAYKFEQTEGCRQESTQTESDLDNPYTGGICGICTVTESKSGRLRASIRFWGPSIPVETAIV